MTNIPGWFLMRREWMDTPALTRAREPYDRCSAWMYLIEHAAYQDTQTDANGHTVTVARGQFSTSFRSLGNAWNWSTTKVRAFIDRLTTDTLIKTEINTGRLLLTLCDYDRFQSFSGSENTAENTSQDTQQTRDQHTINTQKNEVTSGTKRKEEAIGLTASPQPALGIGPIQDPRQVDLEDVVEPPVQAAPVLPTPAARPPVRSAAAVEADFDRWWAAYPRKVGKDDARRAFAKAVKRVPAERLIQALREQEWHHDPRFRPHPATWLTQGRWDDETAPSTVPVRLVCPVEDPDRPVSFAVRRAREQRAREEAEAGRTIDGTVFDPGQDEPILDFDLTRITHNIEETSRHDH